jgi:aspartate-semialdehyde dehydrogenase
MHNKISAGILGATGSVGQKFIQLLSNHPFFTIKEIAASGRSQGKKYSDAVNWILPEIIPQQVRDLIVKSVDEPFESKLLFSALDASVAGEIEENLAKKGHIIVSNARNHRWGDQTPLLIPEVNPDHLKLLNHQNYGSGSIVTNPNCSTIGLVMALKPIHDSFIIEEINIVTMQALSGAGYPGISALDIIDNVIPYIGGEEEKLETEPKKILGKLDNNIIQPADIKISAQTHRVAVIDGHLEAVQIRLKSKPGIKDIYEVWNNFSSVPQEMKLPSAPDKVIHCFMENNYPQPRLHRNLDKGMAVCTGRLRECNLFDFKFEVLSHNTVRGAAGGAILCAELMYVEKYL